MASRVSCVVTHISLPRSGSQVQAYGHHVCLHRCAARGLEPTDQTEIRFRSPRYLFQGLIERSVNARDFNLEGGWPISLNQRSQN